MLQPILQSPHDLILAVLTQAPAVEMHILCQQELTLDGWTFQFAIIGSSHTVQVKQGEQVILQEILACLPLEADQCVHHHACLSYQPHHYTWQGYQTALTFGAEFAPPLPLETTKLCYAFPQVYGQIPLTEIYWQPQGDSLAWWTLHTYPQPKGELQVRTFSRFDLYSLAKLGESLGSYESSY